MCSEDGRDGGNRLNGYTWIEYRGEIDWEHAT